MCLEKPVFPFPLFVIIEHLCCTCLFPTFKLHLCHSETSDIPKWKYSLPTPHQICMLSHARIHVKQQLCYTVASLWVARTIIFAMGQVKLMAFGSLWPHQQSLHISLQFWAQFGVFQGHVSSEKWRSRNNRTTFKQINNFSFIITIQRGIEWWEGTRGDYFSYRLKHSI